ncbi:MAG TPA: hypothetical protein VF454_04685, partial [Gemmatimonadales bacterium]
TIGGLAARLAALAPVGSSAEEFISNRDALAAALGRVAGSLEALRDLIDQSDRDRLAVYLARGRR